MLPMVTRPQSRTVKLKFEKKLFFLSARRSPLHVVVRFFFLYILPITYADVAPVVDAEGRLDDHVFSHVSQQLFQFDRPVCVDGFERRVGVVGEGVVELEVGSVGVPWREYRV